MASLQTSFLILQVEGFWRPPNWTSPWKMYLYNLYSSFMLVTFYSVVIFEIVEWLKSMGNVDVFIDNSLVLMSSINACCKLANFFIKRKDILKLIKMLRSSECCPKDQEEEIIQKHFNRYIRKNSITYLILIEIGVVAVILTSVAQDAPNRVLPFNCWLPYETTSNWVFWSTYVHQFFSMVVGSYVNISYDTLIPGFMMQIHAQLEIFKYRLTTLSNVHDRNSSANSTIKLNKNFVSNESKILADCIKHHVEIFKLADSTNKTFKYTIFLQVSISLILICASVYQLSATVPLTGEFATVAWYLASMLLQIYFFCFFGTKLTHESVDVRRHIYSLEWTSLSISTQKSLEIIMMRTLKSITFSSGYIVVFSLESFANLLKLSYTMYNFLQQAS